jgi:hypothetical protein
LITAQPARSPQISSCSIAAARELMGELADGGGLARAVDPADQDHVRPMRRTELEWPGRRLEDRGDRPGKRTPHLLIRDLLAEAGSAEIGDQLGCGLDPEIRRDQGLLQLLERLGIQPAPGQDASDAVPEAVR